MEACGEALLEQVELSREWILALFTLFAVLALMVWWIGYCNHVVMAEAQARFSLP
jgi:hypothetical protein